MDNNYKGFVSNLQDLTSKYNMVPGIYCIYSLDYKYLYIGSSKNVYKRVLGHLQTLRNKNHCNKILSDYVSKRGVDNLKCKFVKLAHQDDLLLCEQFYIDELNPNLNICKTTDLKRDYQRIQRCNKYSLSRRKPVCKYDYDGNLIEEFPSIISASLSLGEEYRFSSGVHSCITNKRKSYKGFQWKHKGDNCKKLKRKMRYSKAVEIVFDNTSIIFNTITKAAEYLNVSDQTVSKTIRGVITTLSKSGYKIKII